MLNVPEWKLRVQWPSQVPLTSRFTPLGHNDASRWGRFHFAKSYADICWSPRGRVLSERRFNALGQTIGFEIERDEQGRVRWRVPWRNGQMHGLATQFTASGRVLVRSRFVKGAGLDVWADCGRISEVREMRDSTPHGFERWGDPFNPWEENHFVKGRRSGISRQWNGDVLAPGFPKFFIDDEEVSRRRYLRARQLPAWTRDDDRRERTLPFDSVWLAKELRR